jgi:hypothetical protein
MTTGIRAALATLAVLPGIALGQTAQFAGLPADANVIEIQELPPSIRANRALVLWMEHPEKQPRNNGKAVADDKPKPYMCPEETRGSFYRGPTRVSLVDTATRKVMSTVEIRVDSASGTLDEFDIPYWIQPTYYRVDPPLRVGEGKPVIMDLRDYNGDGKALEFAIFEALSCSLINTQLIGYSARRDQVLQYEIRLKGEKSEGNRTNTHAQIWLDRFLLQRPIRPGVWRYTIAYHSGDVGTFEIRYDQVQECFVGTVQWRKIP